MRVFLRDQPRAIAIGTESHVLIFRHSPATAAAPVNKNASSVNVSEVVTAPRCVVEFSPWEDQDMHEYRSLSSMTVHGTLGLVTINNDVFLCAVTGSSKAATVRAGENVQRILNVEFHCVNRSDYDHLLNDQVNPFPTDDLDADGFDHGGHREPILEHPCMALKKLLSGGSFYYSADFDLTKRLQDRPAESNSVAIDSLDAGFLWNTYMIQPLVDFRSRLSERERDALDQSRILTSAIRGFASTMTIPASSSPARTSNSGMPSTLTVISRLSCRRAGTRFNARGIDDDGNVANFVETETAFSTDSMCFSYVQCRGSVPMFWEQSSGLPGQQKISITRPVEATQPAFDKHFERLFETYGDTVAVNLLSVERPQELQLTKQYEYHVKHSSLNHLIGEKGATAVSEGHQRLKYVPYDFHAETRGPHGYEAASGIKRYIMESAIAFEYYLTQEIQESVRHEGKVRTVFGQNEVLKQAGIFRTNCLDCLDRTNLVQTLISQIALDVFIRQQGDNGATSDFWARHGTLWADCGDALSKIYAGTGALKSSFTRSGKMSFAGALADVRKSAQRLYINNFEDKGRQNTIDMLLGRLVGQTPVHLFDPINDWVMAELHKRQSEFKATEEISIYVGTFNLNGKTSGLKEDLSRWLCPPVEETRKVPEIVAIGFQEIVDLDVQQIMSTDPHRRIAWDEAVRETINANARKHGSEEYVLLRGGQLVGASLSVFVKTSVLPYIKNVEGALKKTGMSGMAGNKGAVAIRLEYADTSLCLVTAHLAAGFANYEERNQDYRTISHGLRFQRNRSIEDHDAIIWFGDFNYRIGISNDRARALIQKRDLGTLYENDQLNLQMVHGKSFAYFSEMTPTFLPTYKYNVGTDDYDSSEKARIPAWCDRILTRGDSLRQLYYDAAPLKFSDHRPVWGIFKCTVSVVNQAKKDDISNELYTRRRASVAGHTVSKEADSDDDSLLGYDPLEPGLPPASSDRRKWWLDNGMPATTTTKPPGPGYALNPQQQSNPFVRTAEQDWVKVEKPSTATPLRTESIASQTSRQPSATRQLQPPPSVVKDGESDVVRAPPTTTEDSTNSRTYLKQTLRKQAPPKPEKPSLLRSDSSRSATSTSQSSTAPPPPGPRRPGASSSNPSLRQSRNIATPPPPTQISSGPSTARANAPPPPPSRTLTSPPPAESDGKLPSLPPRKPVNTATTTGLMDDDDTGADGRVDLQRWIPLKPS